MLGSERMKRCALIPSAVLLFIQQEIIGIKFFDLLVDSIGAFGVNGLDNFFGFSIVKELQYVIFFIQEVSRLGFVSF